MIMIMITITITITVIRTVLIVVIEVAILKKKIINSLRVRSINLPYFGIGI